MASAPWKPLSEAEIKRIHAYHDSIPRGSDLYFFATPRNPIYPGQFWIKRLRWYRGVDRHGAPYHKHELLWRYGLGQKESPIHWDVKKHSDEELFF